MRAVPEQYRQLGAFVRESRTVLGATLADVSARAGVSANYLSRVERGTAQPSRALIHTLERALELRLGTLFTRLGQPQLDFVRALTAPDPPLVSLHPHETFRRGEWERYLSHLVSEAMRRVMARLQGLPPHPGNEDPSPP